jgi:hypothetical protein
MNAELIATLVPFAVIIPGLTVQTNFVAGPGLHVIVTLPDCKLPLTAVIVLFPAIVLLRYRTVAIPPAHGAGLVPIMLPAPTDILNVTGVLYPDTVLLLLSVTRAVIVLMLIPSAVIDTGFAEHTIFVALPANVTTVVTPCNNPLLVPITVITPGWTVLFTEIVATPLTALIGLVPSSVAGDVLINWNVINLPESGPLVIKLLLISYMLLVITELLIPSATIDCGDAVLMILYALPKVVVIVAVDPVNPVESLLTLIVPVWVVLLTLIVAIPLTAVTNLVAVVLSYHLPWPDILNVIVLFAEVTRLLLESSKLAVTVLMLTPSAEMLAGLTELTIFVGWPSKLSVLYAVLLT